LNNYIKILHILYNSIKYKNSQITIWLSYGTILDYYVKEQADCRFCQHDISFFIILSIAGHIFIFILYFIMQKIAN